MAEASTRFDDDVGVFLQVPIVYATQAQIPIFASQPAPAALADSLLGSQLPLQSKVVSDGFAQTLSGSGNSTADRLHQVRIEAQHCFVHLHYVSLCYVWPNHRWLYSTHAVVAVRVLLRGTSGPVYQQLYYDAIRTYLHFMQRNYVQMASYIARADCNANVEVHDLKIKL